MTEPDTTTPIERCQCLSLFGDRTGWVFNPASLQTRIGRRVRHERFDAEWVGKVISRIGQAAGVIVDQADERTGRPIKYASAHDLRRSCGERLRNAGVPPLVICRVMRHASWETTRKHYAPGDVQQDAGVLRQIIGNPSPSSRLPLSPAGQPQQLSYQQPVLAHGWEAS